MTTADSNSPPESLSKTQRKQAAKHIQQIGLELADCSQTELQQLGLDDTLLEAVLDLQRITAHGARKRQMQYVGKLLRRIDLEPVQQFLQRKRGLHQHATATQHLLEAWRRYLIQSGDQGLAQLATAYPQLDRQHTRQLLRKARLEAERKKPPAAARALFRLLRDLNDQQPLGNPPNNQAEDHAETGG